MKVSIPPTSKDMGILETNFMTIFLGIDPSITSCGIYDGYEGRAIKTNNKDSDLYRFKIITDKIEEYILPNEETIVGIEGFSFGSHGRAVSKMYGIGWAIRIMLHNKGIKMYEIPPSSVKKFATGKGNGKKEQILLACYKKYGKEFTTNDIADAFIIRLITKHLHEGTVPELEYEKEVIEKLSKQNI